MLTKEHALLGEYLLERHGAYLDPVCRRLFLLGCTEPDWNLLTYVRGSLKHQFLRGHNAENAGRHLRRLTEKLEKSGVQSPLQWFRLGAAPHYLADRFTFAHNRIFTGGLLEHQRYEQLLHPVFLEALQGRQPERISPEAGHAQYLADRCSYRTDCRYILGAALALCARLEVRWFAAPETLLLCGQE